ncbi:MAG: aminotransferase class V-fold PLP-dependent enzyme [Ignavibacteria bacterium]|nr:aminotransferase class V-fold PLP-dependent enzyme [Ignavibacteria bacterium]
MNKFSSDEHHTLASLRDDIVGIDSYVPILDGTRRRYVFLDNAASTPTFQSVISCIENFLPWYSGVHRGTGFKSQIATAIFDNARAFIGDFFGADADENVVIFGKNTTEAVNKISNRFPFQHDDIIVTTEMEHHSNDLPWRKHKNIIHIGVDDDGYLRLDVLKKTLDAYKGKVKLVAVCGASNITGICNPIYDIARWSHNAGAKIFVDAAQLVPHRKINILPNDDDEHIDFLAFSAHKVYAPFGIGVLIAPKEIFEHGEPDIVGGGTVKAVSLNDVYWDDAPKKEEAGTPNVVGIIALAKSLAILEEVGMDAIAQHELELLEYAFRKIQNVPKIVLYGPTKNLRNKVGVITFNIEGMHNALVAAILGTEGAIGIRNGCFCAQPYVKRMLKISPEDDARLMKEMVTGNKATMPGMARASLGCYNNEEDIDAFTEMLYRIVRKEYKGEYILNESAGSYSAKGFDIDVENFFSFDSSFSEKRDTGYSEAS